MTKRLLFIGFVILAGILYAFRNDIPELFSRVPEVKRVAGEIAEDLKDFKKEVLAPPPLRFDRDSGESVLTSEGVVAWTNAARGTEELSALRQNPKLAAAAGRKIDDMFAVQYFEHVSPGGEDAGDFVESAGYEYVLVGENIALGNFEDDKTLVDAWLASPGHRANILNAKYREIGVAAKKGVFEGRETWLAVQIFALDSTACPQPDTKLLSTIESNKRRMRELSAELEILREKIQESEKNATSGRREDIQRHNALVDEYNALLGETKNLVDTYNEGIRELNVCRLSSAE